MIASLTENQFVKRSEILVEKFELIWACESRFIWRYLNKIPISKRYNFKTDGSVFYYFFKFSPLSAYKVKRMSLNIEYR